MRSLVVVALVVSAVSSLVACASGDKSSPPPPSTSSVSASSVGTASFCDTFCQKNHACDGTFDVDTCAAKCSDVEPTLAKLRADVVESVRACIESSDCRQVMSDDRVSGCIDDAAVAVAPSDKAKSLCDALAASLDKCDETFDHAQCLETVKVYGDERLDQAQACVSKSCSAITPCVDANF